MKIKITMNLKRIHGITLIALVVTIIVLLILAGITIGAVVNQNGILGRSKNAAETVNQAKTNEAEALAELENTLEKHTQGASSSSENGNEGEASAETINTGNLTLEEAIKYYGREVDYHPTTDSNGKYRVFYYDATGYFGQKGTLYLKRDFTNLAINPLDTSDTGSLYDHATNSTYIGTDASVEKMRQLNPEWATLNPGETTYETLDEKYYYNEKEVAYLCDTTNWTNFVDSSKADYAVGSPSAEMYCKSYSEKYPGEEEGVPYLEATYEEEDTGYKYSANGGTSDTSTDYDTLQRDGMYCEADSLIKFDGTAVEDDGDDYYFKWWWLASPSANNSDYICIVDGNNASLNTSGNNDSGVCPLVSLKSGVSLTLEQ